MNIRLLSLALQDLETGRRFYEKQQAGLGDYFLDTLFSDIDSLLLYAGFINVYSAFIAACPNASPTPFITG